MLSELLENMFEGPVQDGGELGHHGHMSTGHLPVFAGSGVTDWHWLGSSGQLWCQCPFWILEGWPRVVGLQLFE